MWRKLTMDECWEAVNADKETRVFEKPSFPTRRWGQSFTKTATTCTFSVQKILECYRTKGWKVRKRIDRESTSKFRNLGKFYYIEIYEK